MMLAQTQTYNPPAFVQGIMVSFYVYLHRRPDGEVFYVGKGTGRRAWDFSPSRRTLHHRNIMQKYGRENIVVEVLYCTSETEAHELEREQIAAARARGDRLCNLTDGGEGVAGRAVSEAQKAALAKGRGPDRKLSPEAVKAIAYGLARGRTKRTWHQTEAGKAHVALLWEMDRHPERAINCASCGGQFTTRSGKAMCCSKRCQQRHRRARQAQ